MLILITDVEKTLDLISIYISYIKLISGQEPCAVAKMFFFPEGTNYEIYTESNNSGASSPLC
jgi:hypothetical protein